MDKSNITQPVRPVPAPLEEKEERDITDYVSEVKRKKEVESKEVNEKMEICKTEIENIETRTKELLDSLFDLSTIDLPKAQKITEELKELSEKRIKENMSLYEYQTRINQLKYI